MGDRLGSPRADNFFPSFFLSALVNLLNMPFVLSKIMGSLLEEKPHEQYKALQILLELIQIINSV